MYYYHKSSLKILFLISCLATVSVQLQLIACHIDIKKLNIQPDGIVQELRSNESIDTQANQWYCLKGLFLGIGPHQDQCTKVVDDEFGKHFKEVKSRLTPSNIVDEMQTIFIAINNNLLEQRSRNTDEKTIHVTLRYKIAENSGCMVKIVLIYNRHLYVISDSFGVQLPPTSTAIEHMHKRDFLVPHVLGYTNIAFKSIMPSIHRIDLTPGTTTLTIGSEGLFINNAELHPALINHLSTVDKTKMLVVQEYVATEKSASNPTDPMEARVITILVPEEPLNTPQPSISITVDTSSSLLGRSPASPSTILEDSSSLDTLDLQPPVTSTNSQPPPVAQTPSTKSNSDPLSHETYRRNMYRAIGVFSVVSVAAFLFYCYKKNKLPKLNFLHS